MDQFIIQVFQGVFFASGSDVALLIPVSFYETVYAGD